MSKFKQLTSLVQTTFVAVIAVMLIGGLASTVCHADPPSGTPSQNNSALSQTNSAPLQTNSVELQAGSSETNNVAVKAHLTGAELYSINCNRCHAERFPTERTGAQWKTIMLHMQVRANIPVSQARLILTYLQENSGR
jgi:hypothetical protein